MIRNTNHLAADYFHPFDRMNDFKSLADKINDTVQAKGEYPESQHDFGYAALQSEAKALARDILESDYHIRDGEFALGQTQCKIVPLARTEQTHELSKVMETPSPAKRPVMKVASTVDNHPIRRVPAIKPASKGPTIS